jgi:hypothetical protein
MTGEVIIRKAILGGITNSPGDVDPACRTGGVDSVGWSIYHTRFEDF